MKNEHNCIATIRPAKTALEAIYGNCKHGATVGVNIGGYPLYYCEKHFKTHAGNPKYTGPVISAWNLNTLETRAAIARATSQEAGS